MKQDINFSVMLQSVTKTIRAILKYHYLIFITFMVVGVFVGVYSITNILNLPEDTAYKEEQQKNNINDNFDQATIKKINKLRFSSETTTTPLPSGRTNPFVE